MKSEKNFYSFQLFTFLMQKIKTAKRYNKIIIIKNHNKTEQQKKTTQRNKKPKGVGSMSNTNAFTRPKTLFSVWRKQFSQQPLCSRGNQGPCLSNTDPVHTEILLQEI